MSLEAVKGAFRLTRPLNLSLLAVGVIVGGTLAAGKDAFLWPQNRVLILAAVVAALIGAGANIVNDIVDADIDGLNRPDRPIPAKQISLRAARAMWAVTWIAGLGIALYLSTPHVLIAVVVAGLLYLYSVRLKRILLLGNIAIALLVASAVIYGGLSMGGAAEATIGSVFAFLTTLAREVMKDAQDQVGDASQGVRSLPIRFGDASAVLFCSVVLLLTIALTPVPYLAFNYSRLYLLLVVLVNGLLLASIWELDARDLLSTSGRASALLKGGMAAGMIALAAARMGAPYVLVF